jgi:uncharacterized metal-binding protein YceD (DUF177 family)
VTAPEFSRTVKLDQLGSAEHTLALAASPAECAALAARFLLVSIDSLSASVGLRMIGDTVTLTGRFKAKLIQPCAASAAPIPLSLDEQLLIKFMPPEVHSPDAEVELDADDCDFAEHDGQMIDVGEAVAQSLALALDPFLRKPGADTLLKAAGVKQEGEESVGAFAGLAALRDKLGK